MGPKDFLEEELVPVIDGLRNRNLIDLEECFEITDEKFQMKMSFPAGAFKYLKGYFDNYIFPKLFAFEVKFDLYSFGEVTNKEGIMHLEIIIPFN